MAVITFTIGAITSEYTISDGDVPRILAWAQVAYPTPIDPESSLDPVPPTEQEAWDRVTIGMAQGLLNSTLSYEQQEASQTAIEGVPPVTPPVMTSSRQNRKPSK